MTREIVFRPAAADDLKRLYLHIASDSGAERARAYLGRIERACHALQTFPERGTVRDAILPGLRIIGFERTAAIAFRVTGDTVEILRILRRWQDIPDTWPP